MTTASSPRVFVCAPTFREADKVAHFLASFRNVRYRPLTVLVVNASPGDDTERLLRAESAVVDYDLRQIDGVAAEFWTGTINRALRVVRDEAGPDDHLLLMNVDIGFDTDIVSGLVEHATRIGGGCQVGALGHAEGRVVSSGVEVRSWALGLNRHPLTGFTLDEVPAGYVREVDFLPSRCTLVPARVLRECGLMEERLLPHYGADYEFAHRLVAHGHRAFLLGDVRIESDVSNTGASVFSRTTTFGERVSQLGSIKNPSNVRYRTNFLRLTYPAHALPTAILSYLARTVAEVTLGGDLLRRLLPARERGLSR